MIHSLRILFFVAILISSFSLNAEETNDSLSASPRNLPAYERPIIASITWGPRFTLGSHNAIDKTLFGPIPDLYYSLNYRFAGSIFKHWGLYGEVDITSYYPDTQWDSIFGESFVDSESDCGLFLFNIGAEAGAFYQTSYKRWHLQAYLGYGYTGIYSPAKVSYYESENSRSPHIEIYRNINYDYISGNLTIGFRASRIINIILNIGYSQPLRSSSIEITKHENGTAETSRFHSKAWGQNLSVSAGIQLMCEGRKKKKQETAIK